MMASTSAESLNSLFRPETEQREPRLEGTVILSSPVSIWAPALLLGIAAVIGLLVAAFGEYAIKTPLTGLILPDADLVTINAPADGTIASVTAAEGADLKTGDPVLTLVADGAGPTRGDTAPAPGAAPREHRLVAPVAGRVVALGARAKAGARAGEPLMQILPHGATLEAVLAASGAAAAGVQPGQEVRLTYPGLSAGRSVPARGLVASVSTTTINLEPAPAGVSPGPVRRVVVALEQQSIAIGESMIPLEPGMAVQAEIIRERRSMLAWIFQPIASALRGRRGAPDA